MDIVFSLPHLFYAKSNPTEDAAVLCELVECLARIDGLYLKYHPKTPSIYKSGVVYGRTDEWLPIPACRELGYADCKSVTAWRLAELRARGLNATPEHRWMKRADGVKDFHILLRLDDGTNEDPSKILGMGKDENAYFGPGNGGRAAPRVMAASNTDWDAKFRKASPPSNNGWGDGFRGR